MAGAGRGGPGRRGGRSGGALGVSEQAAWEAHGRWIDDQGEQRRHSDDEGLDAEQVAALREPAGRADE